MERAMIEAHLQQAEEHVALGRRHMERQREIIAELQYNGHDSTRAAELLATLEEVQRSHVAARDRVAAELRELGPDLSDD
jgi:hypothetical protein